MKNKSMASYLRTKLAARNGSNSAVMEIANDMTDAELVEKYNSHHQTELAAKAVAQS